MSLPSMVIRHSPGQVRSVGHARNLQRIREVLEHSQAGYTQADVDAAQAHLDAHAAKDRAQRRAQAELPLESAA